ncbi:MAG: ABC transporter [Rhizobiales bacterium 65-79]|jgi:peptide/nickel transport system permease protein|nr:ABC transporter permease [Hyphomicrobiales bacterium]OJU07005.1 MAG: ABC transporter [Rhizobiales bacterium 65-79]
MSANYLVRRFFSTLLVIILSSVIVFAITNVLPGDAASMVLGEHATPQDLIAVRERLGLDQNVVLRYVEWLGGALTGNFGESVAMQRPVWDVLSVAISRSLILAFSALLIVICIAIPLGVLAAARKGTAVDLVVSLFSYLGIALPEFVTASLFLTFLAGPSLGIFPAGGYASFSGDGVVDALRHLALPALSLTFILMAHISRLVRSEMIDALASDYVRTAVLKGLSRRQVLFKHALRNSLLPAVTIIALDIGYLLGGVLVVEEVFAYPGVGRLMIFAINNRDLPLIQSTAAVIAAGYAFANFGADIIYAWLDPRVQYD